MHRPSGRELANRLRSNREAYGRGRVERPAPDPLAGGANRTRSLSVTLGGSLANRMHERAVMLGVSPRALVLALVRHYADHPELYGVQVDSARRPTLHKQGLLNFDGEGVQ